MTFARPINDPNPRVTQSFSANHTGVDYGYVIGTPIYASADGTVTIATNHYVNAWRSTPPLTTRDYGNLVKIDHGGGWSTLYAHLQKDSLVVSVGQKVKKGQLIARVGNTGNSSGPHLHWEVRKSEVTQNPANHLDTSFTAYGTPPSGGDSSMQYKGYDLTNIDSMRVAVDVLVRVQSGEFVDKPKYEEAQNTIKSLNQSINDRNNDISRLNSENKTLRIELEAARQQAESFVEYAKRVPGLEDEIEELRASRQGYIDENVMLHKAIEERDRKHAEEIKKLTDDALYALVRKIMNIVTGGGGK